MNRTSDIVNIAYGWFERGSDFRTIGEITLPIVQPDTWAAEGWFSLKPDTTQVYYSPGAGQEIYVRIEANGSNVEPTEHSGTAEFCVAPLFSGELLLIGRARLKRRLTEMLGCRRGRGYNAGISPCIICPIQMHSATILSALYLW